MADDVVKVLERLVRRMGREAASSERGAENKLVSATYRERCEGEAWALRLAQGFVREEIRKAKGKAGR